MEEEKTEKVTAEEEKGDKSPEPRLDYLQQLELEQLQDEEK